MKEIAKRKHSHSLDQKRRNAGLCRCGRVPESGYKMCDVCHKISNERAKRFSARKKDAKAKFHLCRVMCCTSEAIPGMKFCGYHLELNQERLKRLRESHIAQGLCVSCNSIAVPGKRRCQKHLDDNLKARIRYLSKRKTEGQMSRIA